MEIKNIYVDDLKLLKMKPPYQNSFLYLESRSSYDVQTRGKTTTDSLVAYSGIWEGYAFIMGLRVEYIAPLGEFQASMKSLGIEEKAKEYVKKAILAITQ